MEQAFLDIQGLAIRRGKRSVLTGFDLAIPRGSTFGLLGPNGAGKTSAFLALAGLIRADEGTLFLGGKALPFGGSELRSRMGVVFQSPALDERLSARENLAFAAGLHGIRGGRAGRRIREMLEFADLVDRAREPVKRLSGGMRRRLELARALIHEPDFLLMDEPTTGLDEASFARAWRTFRALVEEAGATILLTTHRAEEAEMCDRLAFLHEGRIVAEGTPKELTDGVGGDVIELDVADASRAGSIIEEEFGLAVRSRGRRLLIEAEEGPKWVAKIAQALPRGALASIAVHRPGLSDVFLKLTGASLTEEDR